MSHNSLQAQLHEQVHAFWHEVSKRAPYTLAISIPKSSLFQAGKRGHVQGSHAHQRCGHHPMVVSSKKRNRPVHSSPHRLEPITPSHCGSSHQNLQDSDGFLSCSRKNGVGYVHRPLYETEARTEPKDETVRIPEPSVYHVPIKKGSLW